MVFLLHQQSLILGKCQVPVASDNGCVISALTIITVDTSRCSMGLKPVQTQHHSLVQPIHPDFRTLQLKNPGQVLLNYV